MRIFDIPAMSPDDTYHLMTSLVVPRPIGWVSTVDAQGVPNLAPFGYFNVCSHKPPVLHITDTGSHSDTLRNIRATGEFVCHVVSYDHVQAMNFTAIPFPPQENEFEWAGLTMAPAQKVRAPHIAETRARIECRLRQFVAIGDDTMVLGDIVSVSVDPAVMRAGRVEPDLLRPVGRYSGNRYAEATGMYRLPRVGWEELNAEGGPHRLPAFVPGRWRGAASVGDTPPFYGPAEVGDESDPALTPSRRSSNARDTPT